MELQKVVLSTMSVEVLDQARHTDKEKSNISSNYDAQKFRSSTMKPRSKVMDVSVQVVSVDGILAKESSSKEKIKKSDVKIFSNGSENEDFATIVASFAHSVATGTKSFLTHVPSSPLKLSAINRVASQHVVYWPTNASDEGGSSDRQSLSTLQFTRHFEVEDIGSVGENGRETTESRFVPQSCPIHLSISRNGKLVVLGSANVIINGEEKGNSTLTVPIISNLRKSNSPIKKMRRMKGRDDQIQMMKIIGDKFQFGLKSDSTLRVLVRVSGINEVDTKHERSVAEEENKDEDPAHDTTMDSTVSDSDCESIDDCESIEGASVEKDDWEQYMLTQNELRHLRRELAKAENNNEELRMELSFIKSAGKHENERLCLELKELREHVKTTVGSLREELALKQHENELLPVFEERIRELVGELRSRDIEVQNLKDEIEEIRKFYRAQVDSLLPEDNEESEPDILVCSDIESCSSTDEGENTPKLMPVKNLIGLIRNNIVTVTRDEPNKENDHTTPSAEALPKEVNESIELPLQESEDIVPDQENVESTRRGTFSKGSSIQHTDEPNISHSNGEAEFNALETSMNDDSDYSESVKEDCNIESQENSVPMSLQQPTTNVDLLLWDNEDSKSVPDRNKNIVSPGGEGLSSLLGRIRKIRKRLVEARESNDKVDQMSEATCEEHVGDKGEHNHSTDVKHDQKHEASVAENVINEEKFHGSIQLKRDQEHETFDADNSSGKGKRDNFPHDNHHQKPAGDIENSSDEGDNNDFIRAKHDQELEVCGAEIVRNGLQKDKTNPVEENWNVVEEVDSAKQGRNSLELQECPVQSICATDIEVVIETSRIQNETLTQLSDSLDNNTLNSAFETNGAVVISTSDPDDEVEFIGDLFA